MKERKKFLEEKSSYGKKKFRENKRESKGIAHKNNMDICNWLPHGLLLKASTKDSELVVIFNSRNKTWQRYEEKDDKVTTYATLQEANIEWRRSHSHSTFQNAWQYFKAYDRKMKKVLSIKKMKKRDWQKMIALKQHEVYCDDKFKFADEDETLLDLFAFEEEEFSYDEWELLFELI
jgi:hypothetical protein